jgi:hypothetical protein
LIPGQAGGPPIGTQILDQALRHVLNEDVNRQYPRIDEIGKDKIDDAIFSAERDGWFRTFVGKRV